MAIPPPDERLRGPRRSRAHAFAPPARRYETVVGDGDRPLSAGAAPDRAARSLRAPPRSSC
jgi:hypothetical protein